MDPLKPYLVSKSIPITPREKVETKKYSNSFEDNQNNQIFFFEREIEDIMNEYSENEFSLSNSFQITTLEIKEIVNRKYDETEEKEDEEFESITRSKNPLCFDDSFFNLQL